MDFPLRPSHLIGATATSPPVRYAHAGEADFSLLQQALYRLAPAFFPRAAKPLTGEFGSVSVPNVFRRLVPRKTDGGAKEGRRGQRKLTTY